MTPLPLGSPAYLNCALFVSAPIPDDLRRRIVSCPWVLRCVQIMKDNPNHFYIGVWYLAESEVLALDLGEW